MVLLLPELRARLTNHPQRFRGGWIFLTQYGEPYKRIDDLIQWIGKCLDEIGIDRRNSPYPWRHTYASLGLMSGANPAFLAKQLGHTLGTFYATYARWIEGDADRSQLELVRKSWRKVGGDSDTLVGADQKTE